MTLPQIKAMYNGDQQRKEVLVEHGFRLPSAMDNRPLKYEEFEQMWNQVIFVSATPGKIELEKTGGEVVEQVIRPTGLIDPEIEVHPAQGQVPHLLAEIKERAESGRARAGHDADQAARRRPVARTSRRPASAGRYLHSEIQTLERVEILNDLRKGDFDVLVGINLLREGLDLPEVSLVAILDADKAGFLRSETSLIQTIGRAARNVNAKVILYADTITPAMQKAIDETSRRRDDPAQVQRRARHHARRRSRRRSATASRSEVKARRTVAGGDPRQRRASSTRRRSSSCWKKRCSRPRRTWSSSGRPSSATRSTRCKGAPTIKSGNGWAPADGEAEERAEDLAAQDARRGGKAERVAK